MTAHSMTTSRTAWRAGLGVAFWLTLAMTGCADSGSGLDAPGIDNAFCHGLPDGTRCDDQNACTTGDRCGLGVCLGDPIEDGADCDDADLCTGFDQCVAGTCQGQSLVCDALDSACGAGVCDPTVGECTVALFDWGTVCDDGDPCTDADQCSAGQCSGDPVSCVDADNPCVSGTCDASTGGCVFAATAEGEGCDDGDLCTQGDVCQAGACGGAPRDCSGLKTPCQGGACDPQTGECVAAPVPSGTVCDDGNPCTDGETCVSGLCGGGVQVPDGNLCDDGFLCTVDGTCAAGMCLSKPKDCAAVSTSACIDGVCNAETGNCEAVAVDDPACSCWGQPDGVLCDDGMLCTTGDVCADQLCIGQVLDCGLFGDACNDGVCNPSDGTCTKAPANDGGGCDDGLACTQADACAAGACVGAAVSCAGLDGPCSVGVCDDATGGCVAVFSTDGTACDDDNVCTGNDHCEAGQCLWGFDLCAACEGQEIGASCEDGDLCTVGSTCTVTVGKLVCLGQTMTCPDMGPCMFGVCQPETGECLPKPLPDGLFCQDQDPCTIMDVCAGGQCAGAPKDCTDGALTCAEGFCNSTTGACQLAPTPDGEACDDEDLCTHDDACLAGLCVGVAKGCDGAVESACMVAACDPGTGDCGVPQEDGTGCDDLDVCTSNDTCQAGECVGTDTCFCIDKLDGATCDDGYACTVNDTCQGGGCVGQAKDCAEASSVCNQGVCDPDGGACVPVPLTDGTPCQDADLCSINEACVAGACVGAPKDCSAEDTQCTVGACEAATGLCAPFLLQDGLPCDDGDFCTAADVCLAGECAGQVDLCLTCAGLSANDPCEDQDLCTEGGHCIEANGVLVCVAPQKDCSADDGPCTIGVCDPGAGDCMATPRPDGLACDDGEACTSQDQCVAGACAGAAIDMCGEVPLQCESPAPNDSQADAIWVATADLPATLMGWIDPAGETDWYAVTVEAGQLVSVTTRSHCGSELDTQVGLYVGTNPTPLATATGGGEGGFTVVPPTLIAETATCYVGLTAFGASGVGSYLVDINVTSPPPCDVGVACECAQEICMADGPKAGQCAPTMAEEAEPNGTPPGAMPIEMGTEILASFGADKDEDWFAMTLTAAGPVTLETASYCGELTDPEIWITDALGLSVLASNSDGAGDGQARIFKFFAPADGDYLLRVKDEGAHLGRYVVSLQDARCTADADCDCADQQCDGAADAPGKCVPLLASPESGEVASPTVLGARLHAQLDAPYDVDTFVISLAPGTYDVTTMSYCGMDTDTELAVFGPDGTLLGSDSDGGEGFFAQLPGLVVETMGNYQIQVHGYGPSVGEYLLSVDYAAVK